tara:strand:+ start:314 stop:1096 length:783 start_codon:yes stop_codon:yes gene_type:complete
MLELNMGTLYVGFSEDSTQHRETFTENELKLLTCASLGFLSGTCGVSHMINEEIDKNHGWTGFVGISVEEAHERFKLYRNLTSRHGEHSDWKKSKEQCPVPEEWDKLLDREFLQKMADNGWSTNWGNSSTAEFVHKMGWNFGYEGWGMGYFGDFIPVGQNFRWHNESMQSLSQVLVYMLYNYEPRLHLGHHGSEEADWFNGKLNEAIHGLHRRMTPTTITPNKKWFNDYRTSVPLYDGVFEVEFTSRDRIKVTKRKEEEY